MLCAGAWAAEPGGQPTQVRLASEEWLDYTNADGTGLAWDVLREVFQPAGVAVKIRSAPYFRAVGLVKKDEADAWVGSYQNENADNLYPRWHFDVDHIYALGLTSKVVPTLETVGNHRLSWVRGYGYEKYLPNVSRFDEVQRRTGIASMLEHDRTDFYIDAQTEVEYVVEHSSDPSKFRMTHIAELPLYLAFANTARGRELMAIFDKRMESLVQSGQLRKIFARWEQPYPFDNVEVSAKK
ncbi:ABC transporter substrate-binding protein [Pseudomonas sp. R5(2019)]|uniref:substrate-binding periplasmic protein n=1 Tax=Pseudomonas sp. R5(2019) TaxID=2697566 RepID=UPI0021151D2E|nr:transporter substrate-binding domain-containing protein [Pseudomonas sp. R5(2019)]